MCDTRLVNFFMEDYKPRREVDLLTVMGMNRHARRGIAARNGMGKIKGTNVPILNKKETRTI